MLDTLLNDAENLEVKSMKCGEMAKVALDRLFDSFWFIVRHGYLVLHQNFEMRMPIRSSRDLVFAGWINV